MDQHLSEARGRPSSGTSAGGDNQLHKRVNGHSPSPARFPNPVQANTTSATGLGLGIDLSSQQYQSDFFDPSNSFSGDQQSQNYSAQPNSSDTSGAFGLNHDFTQQLKSEDDSYGAQTQGSFSQSLLSSNFAEADFTIFPSAPGDQFSAPLFPADAQQLGGADDSMMATMGQNANQPGSARQSPSLFQMPSFSPPAGHSRNASLQPEMAFLPGQWNPSAPQFQGHRRNPSEMSDVSSVAPSPNLSTSDAFEFDQGHSPMQQPQDPSMFADLQGITNFSISDHGTHSPNHHSGRSPSHSPAISPRLLPQQMPDMHQQQQQQQNYLLQVHHNASYGPPASYPMQAPEAFPSLPQSGPDMQVPNIQVDYAPNHGVDGPNRSALDADSLTPPDNRGRPKQRQRAVTDPFNSGVSHLGHNRTTSGSASLSPNAAGSRSEASRSLSPLDRSGSGAASLSPSPSPNRRRQSTSAVPNNVIALRLAGEEGYIAADIGGPVGAKGRVQKHPATFQCDKCPKRFTRAYNLRSHLRTHTNERPFKCTVCGKSFARQHDRKRHESLHSGEKKFVCKGELQAGVQWGCGRRFARADALGRHFRSEAGRICIKPLLDEERQQRLQQAMAQGMVMQPPPGAPPGMLMAPNMDPNTYPLDNFDNQFLPQALINQFPFLATNWATADAGGGGSGMEDDHSGVSDFDGGDYDGEDGGYVSGSGYGQDGVLPPNYGGTEYASDYGGNGR